MKASNTKKRTTLRSQSHNPPKKCAAVTETSSSRPRRLKLHDGRTRFANLVTPLTFESIESQPFTRHTNSSSCHCSDALAVESGPITSRPNERLHDAQSAFNQYWFIKNLPPHESLKASDRICLPPRRLTRSTPITLVLDLDETLVHCSIDPIPHADIKFTIAYDNVDYQIQVRKRPFLDYFLATVSKQYEVVIFTASQRVYADKLLDILDPHHKHVKHRLFRDACLCVRGSYLKDLRVLGRDLSRVVIVDNSPHAFGYQLDNGIPIESWYDDDSDTELLKLMEFLKRLEGASDVRPVVRSHFQTFALVENAHL